MHQGRRLWLKLVPSPAQQVGQFICRSTLFDETRYLLNDQIVVKGIERVHCVFANQIARVVQIVFQHGENRAVRHGQYRRQEVAHQFSRIGRGRSAHLRQPRGALRRRKILYLELEPTGADQNLPAHIATRVADLVSTRLIEPVDQV